MPFDPKVEEAIFHERHMRIICAGAGPSGLCFAYKLQRSFQNFSLTIYEKNAEVSGTWYENKYPGCSCDVPAHNYTYTFEPNPQYSSVYAPSSEIQKYFQNFSTKYNLQKYIKTLHKVRYAQWKESKGEWYIEIEELASGKIIKDFCHIFINAGGYLNSPRWPDIPGIENFKGKIVHSADWDNTVCLKDKTIALIGNGSSGVQIMPAIQPIARKIIAFIRSPNWILRPVGMGQRVYNPEELEDFAQKPELLMALRKTNEAVMNSVFTVYLQDSILQEAAKSQTKAAMKEKLHNKLLEEKLIPKWGLGCRRLTSGHGYLESLGRENVDIIHGGVVELTSKGCKDSEGSEYVVDVIVCATGFDLSFKPRFPIIGREDLNLQELWAEEPKSYLGIAAAEMPNFFMFLGPYSPVGNGPTLSGIEAQADHILMALDRWQTENIHALLPKSAAINNLFEHTVNFMKATVWGQECRSGWKNHTVNKRTPCLWPGSTLHYIEALGTLRADDWEIQYNGNRFSWLGNGLSQTEFDPTSDLAYYIREHDDSPYASRAKRRKIATKSGSQPVRALHRVYEQR